MISKLISTVQTRLKSGDSSGTLLRGAGGLVLLHPLGLLISFVSTIILTRLMGETNFGVYSLVLAWVHVLVLLTMSGLDTAFVRFLPSYIVQAKEGFVKGLLQYSLQHVAAVSVLTVSLSAFVVWQLLQTERLSQGQANAFWVALILVPLLSLTTLREAGLRSLKQVLRSAIPEIIVRPSVIILLVSITYFFTREALSPLTVVSITIVAVVISFSLGTVWFLRALPKRVFASVKQMERSVWVRVSLPLFFISSMNLVLKRTDIIMVGAFMNFDQVSFYRIAGMLADLGVFGLVAVNAIAAPMISELYTAKKRDELQNTITLAARGIFVLTLLISLFLILFGRFILTIYSPDFQVAYLPLLILLAGQATNALTGSVGFIMTMTGHQNQAALIIGAGALANIVLNAILIPRYGLVGAAVATSISTVFWNMSMLVYVLRVLKLNPTILRWK